MAEPQNSYNNKDYYVDRVAKDYSLNDYANNIFFMSDAKTFLTGDRLNFTWDEINEMSKEEIIDRVQKHFRWKSGNPTTIAKDYAYMDRDTVPQEEKEAYARLSFAFENTQGEGFMDSGVDYFASELANPVNIASAAAGFFTLGTATPIIQGVLRKGGIEAAKIALKQLNKKAITKGVVTGGVLSATPETIIAHYNEKSLVDSADLLEDQDYEYSKANVGLTAGISATTGGVLGGLTSRSLTKQADRTVEGFAKGLEANKLRNAAFNEAADILLQNNLKYNKKNKKLEYILDALAALDPEKVAKGTDIKKAILENDGSFSISSVKLDRIKRISAAGFELSQKLNLPTTRDGLPLRITEIFANYINDSTKKKELKTILKIMDKYGLETEDMTLLYMAEVSEAAKILNMQSQFSKLRKADLKNKAEVHMKKMLESVNTLHNSRFVTVDEEAMQNVINAQNLFNLKGSVSKGVDLIRLANDSRIAFMTSQLATTARNTTFGGAFLLIDLLDRSLETTFRSMSGKANVSELANPTAIMKNMIIDREQSLAFQAILEEKFPVEFRKLFNQSAAAEIETAGMFKNKFVNKMANLGATVNVFNAFSDHQFKRAVLMGTIDRKLAQLNNKNIGTNLREVMVNGTWDEIPSDIIEKGVDEAFRFSFQSQFGAKGEGAASHAAKYAINFFKKNLVGMAGTAFVPFPRYVASQIQFINDYMPFSTLVRPLTEAGTEAQKTRKVKVFDKTTGKNVTVQEEVIPVSKKTTEEAWARNLTGTLPIALAYNMAGERYNNGLQWNEVRNPADGTIINIQPTLGPMALHVYLGDSAWKLWNTNTDISMPDDKTFMQQVALLSIGTDMRGGGNFISDIIFAGGDEKRLQKGYADLLATFTYPASVIKDMYGQFDQRSAMRPETLNPKGQFYNDNVNMLDWISSLSKSVGGPEITTKDPDMFTTAFWNRVGRFLPDFRGSAFDDEDWINIQVFGDDNLSIEQDLSIKDGYDPRYFSPFARHPLYVRDGLFKQILGLTASPVKSELLTEMTKLGLSQYKHYSRHTKSNFIDIVTRMSLSGTMPDEYVAQVQNNPEYKAKTLLGKKEHLTTWIENKVTQRKSLIKKLGEEGYFTEHHPTDYVSFVRGELAMIENQAGFNEWLSLNVAPHHNLKRVNETLNSIEDIPDLTQRLAETTSLYANIRQYYDTYRAEQNRGMITESPVDEAM